MTMYTNTANNAIAIIILLYTQLRSYHQNTELSELLVNINVCVM